MVLEVNILFLKEVKKKVKVEEGNEEPLEWDWVWRYQYNIRISIMYIDSHCVCEHFYMCISLPLFSRRA